MSISVVLSPPVLIPSVVGFSVPVVVLRVVVTLMNGDPNLRAPHIVEGNPLVGVIDHIAAVINGLPAVFHHRAAHHHLLTLDRDQSTILQQSADRYDNQHEDYTYSHGILRYTYIKFLASSSWRQLIP
jgi:hypothetical protein